MTQNTDSEVSMKVNKKIKLKPIKELSKHHNNIKEILQFSNATPIHGRSDLGYTCCYCIENLPGPADLKSHTLELHKNGTKPTFLQKRDLKKYHVKVDITDLECNVCELRIESIDSLMDHLIDVHNRKIYKDVKNHIIPFKFTDNKLRCALCSNEFTKFKILFEHMHKHYSNFTCEECDAGFFNRRSLSNHQTRHKTGEFKCEHCDKIFDYLHKKNSHITTVHERGSLQHKCGYCNQKFSGYRTKEAHLRKAHGMMNRVLCLACEKTFCNQDSLRKHIRRHHLMDYHFKCDLCEKKFSSKNNLKDHMVKHTKSRNFQCEICYKRYGRQQTLREHMRIHENDRRFKCEHCGMAFIQKCGWRRHMQAKHDEHV